MTWVQLSNGWRDESTEGPYIDTLQTKGVWSIMRERSSDMFQARNSETGGKFYYKTLEEAKRAVDDSNRKS